MPAEASIDTTPGVLTPYARLDEVLAELAATLQQLLKGNFVGLYLTGSLAIGDFDLTSDVDFVVVVNEDLNSQELAEAAAAHSKIRASDNRWAKRLEYSFFPLAHLRTLSSPFAEGSRNEVEDRLVWYVNGEQPERSDHDNTLVTRWTLREKGISVLGPAPASFAPEVTPEDLRVEIRNSILGWSREGVFAVSTPHYNRFHQAFAVLNYCRALQDLHEGRITSKREGVAWARAHLDARWHTLIDYCWTERQDPDIHVSQPAVPEVYQEVLAFSEYATEIAQAYAGGCA